MNKERNENKRTRKYYYLLRELVVHNATRAKQQEKNTSMLAIRMVLRIRYARIMNGIAAYVHRSMDTYAQNKSLYYLNTYTKNQHFFGTNVICSTHKISCVIYYPETGEI